MGKVITEPNVVEPLSVSVFKNSEHEEGSGFSWSEDQFVRYPFEYRV